VVAYTVYEPSNASDDRADRAASLVFVKDGFLWLSLIPFFPVFWLLAKRLWLEFAASLAIYTVLVLLSEAIGSEAFASLPILIAQIIFGFEAGAIQGAAIERSGGRFLGSVTGRNRAECERRFLESWLPEQPEHAEANPVAPATQPLRPPPSSSSASWVGPPWNSGSSGVKA
jgi:Protein of unknown function (DUF2628)